jgi:hypothetical protein
MIAVRVRANFIFTKTYRKCDVYSKTEATDKKVAVKPSFLNNSFMKTLLLMLLASCSLLAQIPHSGEKTNLIIKDQGLLESLILPRSPYRMAETPNKIIVSATRKHHEYKVPVKKLSSEYYDMPIENIVSYDKMNAAFYFKQIRVSNQATEK